MDIYSLIFYRALVETVLLIFFSIPFIFVKITNRARDPPVTSNIFLQIGDLFRGSEFYKVFLFILTKRPRRCQKTAKKGAVKKVGLF